MSFRFRNRAEAGRLLAVELEKYPGRENGLVLGLPRGGIPVAYEVARHLHQPLHPFFVRKLGVPGQEELALGAIASGGACFLNHPLIEALGLSASTIAKIMARERQELARKEESLAQAPARSLRGRFVILIDDGLATGATMRAAVMAVRSQEPAGVVIGVPVASEDTVREFQEEVAPVVAVQTPARLHGVGQWYEDFTQTPDETVRDLLRDGARVGAGNRAQTFLQEDV